MDLAELQRHWDAFGRTDPYWAILTDPTRRGNRWPVDEFFETGRLEVADLLTHAAGLGVPRSWRRALDFGCGAGRLTQALGDRFETVVGVDVAPSMIALAQAHNRHGARCEYQVNDQPDLARWADASFDLVYTSRVLQHIEPRYARAYLREFVRVLAPGGYLSFDVPSASGDAVALAERTVPTSAMRARLSVAPDGRLDVAAGAAVPLRVTVTNRSDVAWHEESGHIINVGNHWLEDDGAVRQYDDGRVRLPTPLGPGDEVRVVLVVRAPDAPGSYRLQVDVVQEGVAWFATCGSDPAEVRVSVSGQAPGHAPAATSHVNEPPDARPAADAPQAGGRELETLDPVMEMHAIPREEVEALLARAGARLLDVRRVHHCGPLWLAYRYDATK